jgi:hypothetical protein
MTLLRADCRHPASVSARRKSSPVEKYSYLADFKIILPENNTMMQRIQTMSERVS